MKCNFKETLDEMKTWLNESLSSKDRTSDNVKAEIKSKLKGISKLELQVRKLHGTARAANPQVVENVVDKKKNFAEEFKIKRASAVKWLGKEEAKYKVATQAISDGVKDSTAGFVKEFYGDKANTGRYSKDDVVYLSTNGARSGRVVPIKNGELQGAYKNIDKAITAGAKFVADTGKHLEVAGKYNVGEVELAKYLESKGYERTDKEQYGLWEKKKVVETKRPMILKNMNGAITDQKGNATVSVTSLDMLKDVSRDLKELLKDKQTRSLADEKVYNDGFDMLEKAGIEFKPFKLRLMKQIAKDGGLGEHNTKAGTIKVATGEKWGTDPQHVVLHEYIHRLTSENLDKYPVLRRKVKALREYIDKNIEDADRWYGLSDDYELLAEAMSNPEFQRELSKLPPFEGKSVTETLKKIVQALLDRLGSKERSALTDVVELTIQVANAREDIKEEKEPGVTSLNINFGTNENKELSNLAYRPFKYGGRDYVSVEHAYQSLKSGKFNEDVYDNNRWADVQLGKLVKITGSSKPYTKNNWNITLMEDLIQKSFEQNPKSLKRLRDTKDAELKHTQGDAIWRKEFPRILTKIRSLAGKKDVKQTNAVDKDKAAFNFDEYFKELVNEKRFLELDKKEEMTDDEFKEYKFLDNIIGYEDFLKDMVNEAYVDYERLGSFINVTGDKYDDIMGVVREARVVKKAQEVGKDPHVRLEEYRQSVREANLPKDKYELFDGVYSNKGQTAAINKIRDWWKGKDRTFLLKGRGGTGKTTIVNKVIEQLGIHPSGVVYAAYTNKAVGVLENTNKGTKAENSAYLTTAQILKLKPVTDFRTGVTTFVEDPKALQLIPMSVRIFVVDEVSMLPRGQQAKIEKLAADKGIKILYMGDDVQLPPVNELDEKGQPVKQAKVFDDHKGKENMSELAERMRQGEESPILPITDILANAVLGRKKFADVGFGYKNNYQDGKGVLFTNSWDEGVLKSFVADFRQDPAGTRYIHYNKPTNINTEVKVTAIRNSLFGEKAVGEGNKFLKGEQVTFNAPYMFEEGDDMITVDNATEGTIEAVAYDKKTRITYEQFVKGGKERRVVELPAYTLMVSDNNSKGKVYKEIVVADMEELELKTFKRGLQTKYGGVWQVGFDNKLADVGHAYVITAHKSQGSTYNTVYADMNNIGSMPISDDEKLKAAYVATSRPRNKLVVIDTKTGESRNIPANKVELKSNSAKIMAKQLFKGLKDC